jgi:GNAT superfamily N-acetyltransferase
MTMSEPTTTASTLRQATLDDVPRLTRLVQASIRGFGASFYDDAQLRSSLEHLYGVDRQLIEDGTYFVIEEGDNVVAAGGWSYRRTTFGGDQFGAARDATQRDPRLEPAAIRAFYVHPERKRRGLGRRLHDACEAAAHAAGFRRLELLSTEMGAVFYRELGYTRGETERAELPDGVRIPIIHMVKPIEAPSEP